MPKVYDDWDRLVRATLRREELWQLFHDHSRTPSGGSGSGSTTSGSGSASPILDLPSKTSIARASPLSRPEVGPKTSTSRVSPLNGPAGARQMVSPLNRGEVKAEKSMTRNKSRARLDRWVWTRWLSNTFK